MSFFAFFICSALEQGSWKKRQTKTFDASWQNKEELDTTQTPFVNKNNKRRQIPGCVIFVLLQNFQVKDY